MWVQMEWFCPLTTPRTTPVDRSACILSPCPRTTVWILCIFVYVSQCLPIPLQIVSTPIVPMGRAVSLRGQLRAVALQWAVEFTPDTHGRKGPVRPAGTKGGVVREGPARTEGRQGAPGAP